MKEKRLEHWWNWEQPQSERQSKYCKVGKCQRCGAVEYVPHEYDESTRTNDRYYPLQDQSAYEAQCAVCGYIGTIYH
jgi:hypothetical protein